MGFSSWQVYCGLLLVVATRDWQRVIDQGGSVMSVFFDIQKAFDSVPHSTENVEKTCRTQFTPTASILSLWLY